MSDKFFNFKISDGNRKGKLVSCAGLVYQYWTQAEATVGDDDGVGTFELAEEESVVVDGIANLSCARQLQLAGNKSTVTGVDVKIIGTNIENKQISEVVTLNGLTAVATTKAFKRVDALILPERINEEQESVDNDAVVVGYTEKLGLKASARAVVNLGSYAGDVADANVAFTCDKDEVEKNMIKFNSSLGTGTRDTCYFVRE